MASCLKLVPLFTVRLVNAWSLFLKEEILTKSVWLNPIYEHFKEVRKSKTNPEITESNGQGKLNSVHICILISTSTDIGRLNSNKTLYS